MTFSSLGLSAPLLQALEEKGYNKPYPIQLEAIPIVLAGKDVMAAAQTGTGKTASFTLPLLQRLDNGERVKAKHIRALVLTPTRELAAQVADSVAIYGQHVSLKSTVVFGGVKINPQINILRGGVDVLVATPGRLIDLYNQNALKFSQVEILVLDEADRMLDMGFIRDIKKILALLPKTRQTLLFSATFSEDIRRLTDKLLKNPVQIEVSPRNAAAQSVKQSVYEVDKSKKTALLSHLISTNNWDRVLVFTRTKHGANRLTQKLQKDGISAVAIHGNKSQGARTRALAEFKANEIRVLVATDIAARGIDIIELPHVVNFELPNIPEDYVHRIGRTGRASSLGEAISLVSADEVKFLSDIEKLIQQTLVREIETGFVPSHSVPITHLKDRSSKHKTAKKPANDKKMQNHTRLVKSFKKNSRLKPF
ncbi:MAG: DEAD/DEAH box helicase [Methylococcales symbiont of Hymedesmia sp. n. MRB-2018]|nr:MAG: DEAD/DEAH box helicase [Methylococcales symbiont of Hymedesmia sp. n. MRB-2018]